MTKKFVWPADMRPMEISYPGTALDGRPAWIVKTIRHRSLDEPRFHWLLNVDRGWYGEQTPQTYKNSESGLTRAYSGLLSRGGYARIIREPIPATVLEGWIIELTELIPEVLEGRQRALFERCVLPRLLDPFVSRPSFEELAREFNTSPNRIRKDLYKARKKLAAAVAAAEVKAESISMNAKFDAKRTGGVTYQDSGQFWAAHELAQATVYTTSINSAWETTGTNDIKDFKL